MRIRRSEGIIERYGVTLSPGLPVEKNIIETLLACPKGRRQQWLRKLLSLGMGNRHISLPVVDNWTAPQGEPVPNKLVSIGLDRRAPEDVAILTFIESLPLVRRSQALRSLLVVGMHAPQKTAKKANRSGSSKTSQEISKVSAEKMAQTEEFNLSRSVHAPGLPMSEAKSGLENDENKVESSFSTRKVRDNPSQAIKLDEEPAAEQGVRLTAEKSRDYVDNEVDNLPATETVISGLQNSVLLDIDLSALDSPSPEPVRVEKLGGLSAMRSLLR